MNHVDITMTPYYSQDGIVIYHGDCRLILPHLPKVDLVLTDPPYGMKKAAWDMDIMPVCDWLPMAREMAPVVLFCGVRGTFDYPKPDWILSWVRLGSTQRSGSLQGFNNWEPILAYGIKKLSHDVIFLPNFPDETNGDHPTPKPLAVMRALLHRLPSGTVLDPFMGTGTTLVAARQLGRCALGIEIEERYCEIAAKRLAQSVMDFSEPKVEAVQEELAL